MTTKHKLRATLAHGPKDMGAEIDAEIAFSFTPGGRPSWDDPGWGEEIELISAEPLRPFDGAFADMERRWLDDLAREWLESDEGRAAALEEVAAELEDARAFIAELRRES